VNKPIGWDIGGAHLKAVRLDATGKVLAVRQVYCPLWRGLHELDAAIDTVLSEFNINAHVSAQFVTMTGELADIFPNRSAGVMQIAQLAAQKLSGKVMFYAGEKGFVTLDAVAAHTSNIASMNWLASVQFVAQKTHQALFLDIGSTTTDIALIRNSKPYLLGVNDAARMQTDELVYSGVVRTPLMALAQKIIFNGNLVNVAAEHFATTSDVYTLTADLALAENMAETADGADKSIEASARRIARMVGLDAEDAPLGVWRNLAFAFKQTQLNQLKQAVLRQSSRLEDYRDLLIVGCGVGDFLACELANQLGFKYASVTDFISAKSDGLRNSAAVCFPAYAVANLGAQC
jgi:probable H4MPT-linked C1 transfer pathway protein